MLYGLFSCKGREIMIGKWVKPPCCLDAVRKELSLGKNERVGEDNRKSRNSCEPRDYLFFLFVIRFTYVDRVP